MKEADQELVMVKIETAMTKAEIENAYMDCLEIEQRLTT